MNGRRTRIWIDLENTPHVPFFAPIVRALESSGCEVLLTARNFAQTVELANSTGLNPRVVGRSGSTSPIRKMLDVLSRALGLYRFVRGKKINLAVSHGSRGLLLAAKLRGIRTLTLYDYEGASVGLFNRWSDFVMTPEVITSSELQRSGLDPAKHLSYPGLKEEVYLSDFKPSTTLPVRLGLESQNINVVVRPPSDTAHYRSEASKRLFDSILTLIADRDGVQVILLPRDARQRSALQDKWRMVKNITMPDRAVDGASLLYYSDLVVGGGGTMNREAAVLGVPVLSIFKGEEGAVDRSLKAQGKLIDIQSADDILPFIRHRDPQLPIVSGQVRMRIVAEILRLAAHN